MERPLGKSQLPPLPPATHINPSIQYKAKAIDSEMGRKEGRDFSR